MASSTSREIPDGPPLARAAVTLRVMVEAARQERRQTGSVSVQTWNALDAITGLMISLMPHDWPRPTR